MRPDPRRLATLAAINLGILLLLGFIIVNFVCQGHCGGATYPGVPYGN